MRKRKVLYGLLGCAAVLMTSPSTTVRAEAPPVAVVPHGRVMLFYSPATTVLKAPTLAGGTPEFENDGKYFGFSGEVYYGKVSLNGFYQDGTTKRITGGTDFTAPTFNAVTHEHSTQVDVSVGYTVLNNRHVGAVDVTAGYYRLWAKPEISPANWYDGPEIGLKGRRVFESKLAITYKLGYLPVYRVHGWMKGKMRDDHGNIMLYRVGLEYPIDKNIAVTAGYQRARLAAEVIEDESSAIVTLSGFYYGLVVGF